VNEFAILETSTFLSLFINLVKLVTTD